MKCEFSIMPPHPMYHTTRQNGLVRHEVMFGNGRRKKSIQYGLVVFLTPSMHNGSNQAVHFNREFDLWLKREAQKAAMAHYGWSQADFVREFYMNYLEDQQCSTI